MFFNLVGLLVIQLDQGKVFFLLNLFILVYLAFIVVEFTLLRLQVLSLCLYCYFELLQHGSLLFVTDGGCLEKLFHLVVGCFQGLVLCDCLFPDGDLFVELLIDDEDIIPKLQLHLLDLSSMCCRFLLLLGFGIFLHLLNLMVFLLSVFDILAVPTVLHLVVDVLQLIVVLV